jgi:hypothetical protein
MAIYRQSLCWTSERFVDHQGRAYSSPLQLFVNDGGLPVEVCLIHLGSAMVRLVETGYFQIPEVIREGRMLRATVRIIGCPPMLRSKTLFAWRILLSFDGQ